MPNDYFLTKVYESLQAGNGTKPLKPQNLQQAYKVILKQITEDADILMQSKDEQGKPYGDVEEFTVSDEVAKQIKSSIQRGRSLVGAEGKTTTIEAIIKEVLTVSNWQKTTNLENLIENIVSIFNKEELVLKKITEYPSLLQKSENTLKQKLINNPFTKINLKDLVPEWFKSLFGGSGGERVVMGLWNIIPNTKPASGRGEIALTLISNSKKAPEGDLIVDGELIEMKGSNGTMGGDNHIIDTSNELNTILKKDLAGVSMANRKKEIIKRIDKLIQKKEQPYQDFKQALFKQIEEDTPLESIKKFIEQGPVSQTIKKSLYTSVAATLTIPKFNFRDSLLAFFSQQDILTDEQIAEGIFAARNYKKITSPSEVKSKIKNLVTQNRGNLFKKDLDRQFTYELAALISALHVCCYQETYKFKGIIFVNDENKNMVYCKFQGNSVQENLDSIYQFILNFKPSINLSMTQIQKAAGFRFFT